MERLQGLTLEPLQARLRGRTAEPLRSTRTVSSRLQ
jgi:hypothetical protein